LALAGIEAVIVAALAATGRTALPTEAAIDGERLEQEQKRRVLDARRSSLDAAREEQQEAVETAVARRTSAETKLEMLHKSVAEDLALCPDADRAARDALPYEARSMGTFFYSQLGCLPQWGP
jgi:hypothetical protein